MVLQGVGIERILIGVPNVQVCRRRRRHLFQLARLQADVAVKHAEELALAAGYNPLQLQKKSIVQYVLCLFQRFTKNRKEK